MSSTEEQVLRDGFGSQAFFEARIAEWEKRPAGYALFYDHYASFQGGPAMLLEEMYVRKDFRRKGIGKALFAQFAAIAQAKNSVTILFNVLDWNTATSNVYRSLGATFLDDWETLCFEGAAVDRLARLAGRGAQP